MQTATIPPILGLNSPSHILFTVLAVKPELGATSVADIALAEHEMLKIGLALFGFVTLAGLAYWASLAAPPAATRAALILRSAYEEEAGDAVRQYRVALKLENKPELCFFAGMIASAYTEDKDQHAAWQQQEGLDCAAARMERLFPHAR